MKINQSAYALVQRAFPIGRNSPAGGDMIFRIPLYSLWVERVSDLLRSANRAEAGLLSSPATQRADNESPTLSGRRATLSTRENYRRFPTGLLPTRDPQSVVFD